MNQVRCDVDKSEIQFRPEETEIWAELYIIIMNIG